MLIFWRLWDQDVRSHPIASAIVLAAVILGGAIVVYSVLI